MSSANKPADDNDQPPDLTVDPSDPEPRFADPDNPTEAESLAYSAWLRRNLDALGRRGVECYIDEDE